MSSSTVLLIVVLYIVLYRVISRIFEFENILFCGIEIRLFKTGNIVLSRELMSRERARAAGDFC